MELIDFLRVETDSQKLKVDQKFVGWASSKNGCGQSGHKTQKRSKKDSSLLIYDTLKSAVC